MDIFEILEALGKRPEFYVQSAEASAVVNFLQGLSFGCAISGVGYSWDVYRSVAESRGWKWRDEREWHEHATGGTSGWTWREPGIVWSMREKGLDEPAIIQELVEIEMEAYRRAQRDRD